MKKPKCMAPWMHSYVGPDGLRALCCHADPFQKKYSSFEEYWNSEELKNVRLEMLSGSLPAETCQACLDPSIQIDPPYEHYQTDDSKTHEYLDRTDEKSGVLEDFPEYLDYRLDNQCNLACRTCNGLYSSKIAAEEDIKIDPSITDYQKELRDITKRGEVKKLYFANGEPLIQKSHWEAMQEIVDAGKAQDISIDYNTNLFHNAFWDPKCRAILDQFKEVNVSVSLDHVEDGVEFIRDGVNWARLEKNILKLKAIEEINLVAFDITFTLPLLLNPAPLMDFLMSQKVPYNIQMVTPGGYATLLSPFLLSKTLLRDLFYKALETARERGFFMAAFQLFLQRNLQELENKSPFSKEVLKEAWDKVQKRDRFFQRQELISYYQDYPVAYTEILKRINETSP